MAQAAIVTSRRPVVLAVVAALLSGLLVGAVGTARAAGEETTVTGGATGYFAELSLFGGPPSERGPDPVVELAPDGSDSPKEASVSGAAAVFGPAVVFRSGQIDVGAEATSGPGASVTSRALVEAVLEADPGDPQERPGPMLYDAMESTCTADEDGFTVTTTVAGGVVETRYDAETQEPVETEEVPPNPEPGYTVEGTIDHVGDRYRIVYNEQIVNDDGSLTVNAAHMYLLGDIAVGDLIVGQTTCGTSATPAADGPIENTGTPPDSVEADDPAEEDGAAEDEPVEAEAAEDEPVEDSAAPPDDDGVPLGALGLGLGALVVTGIVVALVLGRRSKAPADDGGDR